MMLVSLFIYAHGFVQAHHNSNLAKLDVESATHDENN